MQAFEVSRKKNLRHKDLLSFLWNVLATWYSWNIAAQAEVITVKAEGSYRS